MLTKRKGKGMIALRYGVGEHRQRQGHRGESSLTRLIWALWELGRGNEVQQPMAKGTKGWVIKVSASYREEHLGEGQPSPWAGEFSVEGGVC